MKRYTSQISTLAPAGFRVPLHWPPFPDIQLSSGTVPEPSGASSGLLSEALPAPHEFDLNPAFGGDTKALLDSKPKTEDLLEARREVLSFQWAILWLPGMDSNHDSRLQRPLSYR
jgi:hypothetical protein